MDTAYTDHNIAKCYCQSCIKPSNYVIHCNPFSYCIPWEEERVSKRLRI